MPMPNQVERLNITAGFIIILIIIVLVVMYYRDPVFWPRTYIVESGKFNGEELNGPLLERVRNVTSLTIENNADEEYPYIAKFRDVNIDTDLKFKKTQKQPDGDLVSAVDANGLYFIQFNNYGAILRTADGIWEYYMVTKF